MYARVLTIDLQFPLSLGGFSSIKYHETNIEKEAFIILILIPTKESTTIIVLGLEQDHQIFEKYSEYFFSSPLNVLNMIESFMVNGSDHWYISPEYWKKIPINKREKVLYDILYTEDSILDEYSISIFDDIRERIISIFKENTKHRKYQNLKKKELKLKCESLTKPISILYMKRRY